MPNSLHSSAIDSPARRRPTNWSLSSMTEHSFQGIAPSPKGRKVSPMCPVQCVTYVVGPLTKDLAHFFVFAVFSNVVENVGTQIHVFCVLQRSFIDVPQRRLGCGFTSSEEATGEQKHQTHSNHYLRARHSLFSIGHLAGIALATKTPIQKMRSRYDHGSRGLNVVLTGCALQQTNRSNNSDQTE